MTPFLKQVAEHYYKAGGISERCFVFPNRRSLVFFQKYLVEAVAADGAAPIVAPKLMTMSDMFSKYASMDVSDRVTLLIALVEMSEERFSRIFDINLFGLYRLNKEFLPLLKKGSKIVITSSELAPLDPLPFTGIYAITKAAVEKYAYSLRMEMNLLGDESPWNTRFCYPSRCDENAPAW